MYFQRVLRRPKPAPVAEKPLFELCSGCVTPKFCKSNTGCDVANLKKPAKKRAKRK